jgi:hypothetical protein
MFFNHGNHLETAQSLCPFKMLTYFLVLVVELQNQWYIFYEGDIVKVYTSYTWPFCNSVFYRNTICTHNRANHQSILTNCF